MDYGKNNIDEFLHNIENLMRFLKIFLLDLF